MDILILRDPRESAAKCSLTPLRGLPGVRFAEYHPERRLDAGERVLLHPDGELLSSADRGRDLLLIDCAFLQQAQQSAIGCHTEQAAHAEKRMEGAQGNGFIQP